MMQLTSQLAEEISWKTSSITGYDIFIVNTKGVIIGASDILRIGHFHEASIHVLQAKKPLSFTAEEATNLKGVRAGIVLPIFFSHNIIGVVGITGDPKEVGKFGELVRNQVEMMCQQSFTNEIIKLRERAKETLVHEVISGEPNEALISRGLLLGYNLTLPRIVIIAEISDYGSTTNGILGKMNKPEEGEIYVQFLQDTILRTIESMKTSPEDIVSQTTLDKMIILAKANPKNSFSSEISKIKDLAAKLILTARDKFNLHISIGIGSIYEDLSNIRLSYMEANQALKLGNLFSANPCDLPVYHIDDLGISSILSELKPNISTRFVEKKLKSLLQDKHFSILKETLTAFCDNNLNISETSKALYLHRNTLLYRLNKIAKLTGLDPKNFNDAVQLYAAFQLKSLTE
jgi:carbohydrate diacid regulator